MSGSSLPPFQVSRGRKGFARVCLALGAFESGKGLFTLAFFSRALGLFAA